MEHINIKINYYLIHGVDKSRKPRMKEEFSKWGLDNNKVKWMEYPNKNEISNELYKSIVNQNDSWCCGTYIQPNSTSLGVVSCSYKHYLSLKDISESDIDYGVIMEDNIYFIGNVEERVKEYIKQLDELYPEWDIIFDSGWAKYSENHIIPGCLVYPKNIEINDINHGGTRCAHMYLIKKKTAKKLSENYLPFNHAPDWYMNDLFRKFNIKAFWGEPSIAQVYPHVSTAF
jgi:GR25 family glycosyltransferase involved in LPS biosynthesis